jgi:RimJ/RimL family protein N-acetyltransferase
MDLARLLQDDDAMSDPDFQPTLESGLVQLRPVRAADWDEMFAVASDPQIWEVHPVRNRYEEPVFRGFFDSALSSGSALTILDRRTGEIIGSSRYHDYDPERSDVEIGWTFIARRYWGGVYNREIKRLMLEHAFRYVDTVVFMVGETNFRSQRAMEKIGGVRRPGLVNRGYHGDDIRHVVFEIRKSNWD